MSEQKPVYGEDVKPASVTGDVQPQAIPFERFNEVNERMKKAEKELQKVLDAQKKAQDEDAKKRGEFEKLLAERERELESVRANASEWENYQATRREALLSKLPQDQRDIYSGLTLEALEKHIELVSKSKHPTNQGTPALPESPYKSLIEAARAFAAGKIKKEEYERIRQQLNAG